MESGIVKAVGVWFYCVRTHCYLYLLRNDSKYPDTWGLAGGKVEATESLMAAVERECTEELGSMPEYQQLIPIEKFTSPDGGFEYHTFWCRVNHEFIVDTEWLLAQAVASRIVEHCESRRHPKKDNKSRNHLRLIKEEHLPQSAVVICVSKIICG